MDEMRVRLFNDASALLVYRLAVAATLSPARVIPLMVAATAGSVELGLVPCLRNDITIAGPLAEADPYGRL